MYNPRRAHGHGTTETENRRRLRASSRKLMDIRTVVLDIHVRPRASSRKLMDIQMHGGPRHSRTTSCELSRSSWTDARWSSTTMFGTRSAQANTQLHAGEVGTSIESKAERNVIVSASVTEPKYNVHRGTGTEVATSLESRPERNVIGLADPHDVTEMQGPTLFDRPSCGCGRALVMLRAVRTHTTILGSNPGLAQTTQHGRNERAHMILVDPQVGAGEHSECSGSVTRLKARSNASTRTHTHTNGDAQSKTQHTKHTRKWQRSIEGSAYETTRTTFETHSSPTPRVSINDRSRNIRGEYQDQRSFFLTEVFYRTGMGTVTRLNSAAPHRHDSTTRVSSKF